MVSNIEEFYANIKRNARAASNDCRVVLEVKNSELIISSIREVYEYVPYDSDIPAGKIPDVYSCRVSLNGSCEEKSGRLCNFGVTTTDVFFLVNRGDIDKNDWKLEL